MNFLRIFLISFVLTAVNSFAQDVVVEDLPVATINESYYVTLPEIPVQDFYYIDISHLDFEDEQEAIYLLGAYVTGNLITNQVFYADQYMIIQIHKEYVGGEVALEELQAYLGLLTKPKE